MIARTTKAVFPMKYPAWPRTRARLHSRHSHKSLRSANRRRWNNLSLLLKLSPGLLDPLIPYLYHPRFRVLPEPGMSFLPGVTAGPRPTRLPPPLQAPRTRPTLQPNTASPPLGALPTAEPSARREPTGITAGKASLFPQPAPQDMPSPAGREASPGPQTPPPSR